MGAIPRSVIALTLNPFTMITAREQRHASCVVKDAFAQLARVAGGAGPSLAVNRLVVLIGQLWNCTDVVPRDWVEEFRVVPGSTYAQAVRRLARFG